MGGFIATVGAPAALAPHPGQPYTAFPSVTALADGGFALAVAQEPEGAASGGPSS